jgi:hypothetical protein
MKEKNKKGKIGSKKWVGIDRWGHKKARGG